ncbi:MAG: GIY-YIG nuclease family protein [Bacteroidota bacterium]
MYKVYALKSIHKKYIYVGLTSNIEKRLQRHNAGLEKTTKHYAPFRIIYTKDCQNREDAREFEKKLKTTKGKRFLRKFSNQPR